MSISLPQEERKKAGQVLKLLYTVYEEQGPGAMLTLSMIQRETGLEYKQLLGIIQALAASSLVRFWELGDAASLGPLGLEVCQDSQRFSEFLS